MGLAFLYSVCTYRGIERKIEKIKEENRGAQIGVS
jgi:hypothetical protein